MKNNYIGQAWLVLVLALGFGGSLAGVQTALSPRIEANKLEETKGQIPRLVPGSIDGERDSVGDQIAYRATDEQGQTLGWVVPAGGQGFADRIELLLGVNPDGTRITGLYILEQRETPGLGNKIVEPAWRDQFNNKDTSAPLIVVKTGARAAHEIDAITGATISSDSVVGIVNRTATALRKELGGHGGI